MRLFDDKHIIYVWISEVNSWLGQYFCLYLHVLLCKSVGYVKVKSSCYLAMFSLRKV